MKATGVVRKMDELGRIVIPKEIRRTLEIEEGTPLEIFVNDHDQIILKVYQPGCQLCGQAGEELVRHQRSGKVVCKPCIEPK